MFNPALIKPVIGFTVSVCTSRTVGQIIRANITPTSNLHKVQLAVAGGALGMMAGSAAKHAVMTEIEETEQLIRAFKEGTKTE